MKNNKQCDVAFLSINMQYANHGYLKANIPVLLLEDNQKLLEELFLADQTLKLKQLDLNHIYHCISEGYRGEIIHTTTMEGDIIKVTLC